MLYKISNKVNSTQVHAFITLETLNTFSKICGDITNDSKFTLAGRKEILLSYPKLNFGNSTFLISVRFTLSQRYVKFQIK